MTHAPRITDESVLTRWMGLEIAKMNEGVVTQRKSLAVLLAEKDPLSVTKKGEAYHFDPSVIATLGKALPEDLQRRLRLPILFYASPDVPDSCMCPDETALAALQAAGRGEHPAYLRGRPVLDLAPDCLRHHEEVSHGGADRYGGMRWVCDSHSPYPVRHFIYVSVSGTGDSVLASHKSILSICPGPDWFLDEFNSHPASWKSPPLPPPAPGARALPGPSSVPAGPCGPVSGQ